MYALSIVKNRDSHLDVGRKGEHLACVYLVERGYHIIERNYQRKFGEIDIVAQAPDRTLVFVEVKTLKSQVLEITPEDQITAAKKRKLRRICSSFANTHPELIKETRGWRIDLVAVELNQERPRNHTIRHYENI